MLKSEHKVEISFVLEHASMDELIVSLIDRRVSELSFWGLQNSMSTF